jgi:hypothetical protein
VEGLMRCRSNVFIGTLGVTDYKEPWNCLGYFSLALKFSI